MQILYAPPAAGGVSTMVAVSGDDSYLFPVSGLLPEGGRTLDYLLWGALAAGIGRYVMNQKDPKKLAMYAAGGVAARIFL